MYMYMYIVCPGLREPTITISFMLRSEYTPHRLSSKTQGSWTSIGHGTIVVHHTDAPSRSTCRRFVEDSQK